MTLFYGVPKNRDRLFSTTFYPTKTWRGINCPAFGKKEKKNCKHHTIAPTSYYFNPPFPSSHLVRRLPRISTKTHIFFAIHQLRRCDGGRPL